MRLITERGCSPDCLQSLADSDAFSLRGSTIELQHEILADYLRAGELVKMTPTELVLKLEDFCARPGSYIGALAMALTSDHDKQSILWKKVAALDISSATNALKYRAAREDLGSIDAEEITLIYLRDILEGLEVSMERYWSAMAPAICAQLVGAPTESIGIAGTVEPNAGRLIYSFKSTCSADRVTVGTASESVIRFYKDLTACGLGLDSGRLVGMTHLKDAILHLIDHRCLKGGPVYTEEMSIGRLLYLQNESLIGSTEGMKNEEIISLLTQYEGRWVMPTSLSAAPTFAIDDLIRDLACLAQGGRTCLPPWWSGAGTIDVASLVGQRALGHLIDLHYKRTQLCYREIIEHNFPALADKLPFYQMMPVRYNARVKANQNKVAIQWSFIPVLSVGEIGALVTFDSDASVPHVFTLGVDYVRRIDDALACFGRSAPDRFYTSGAHFDFRFFDEEPTHYGQPSETSVIRSATNLIRSDILYLFKDLPRSGL